MAETVFTVISPLGSLHCTAAYCNACYAHSKGDFKDYQISKISQHGAAIAYMRINVEQKNEFKEPYEAFAKALESCSNRANPCKECHNETQNSSKKLIETVEKLLPEVMKMHT